MAPDSTRARGTRGEDLALAHLEGRGYRSVARNWRSPAGELDLVMLDGDCLVVVEVKMRQGEAAGRAEQAVSAAQARRLLNAGEHFVAEHPEYADLFWRCDLVAITLQPNGEHSIRHLVNAIVTG